MPNYLEILSDCYPDAQAYVIGNDDPTVYTNLLWLSTQISQATLDASICNIQSNDIVSSSASPILQYIFSDTFSISNKWLSIGNGIDSYAVPLILPWDCRLVGLSFNNKYDNINIDVELHSITTVDNVFNKDLTFNIVSAKEGYKTNIPNGISYLAGNKLGIYLNKVDNSIPKDVIVILYLQILDTSVLGEFTK